MFDRQWLCPVEMEQGAVRQENIKPGFYEERNYKYLSRASE